MSSLPFPPRSPATSTRLLAKTLLVGLLSLLLLIPLGMIQGTVRERQAYREEAVAAVAESFAGPQSLAGPVLVLDYVDEVDVPGRDSRGAAITTVERSKHRLRYFPADLAVEGVLRPAVRRRGLHEVRVYELQADAVARFDLRVPATPANVRRRFEVPHLGIGVADVRGLVGTPRLRVDGRALALTQGVAGEADGSGVQAALAPVAAGERLRFEARFSAVLGGTESLSIAPVADANHIRLRSSWPHPQFAGRFLPRERRIDAKGFLARWDLSSLAAGTQQQYAAGKPLDMLTVSLVDPVNVYSQADRATKYGLLFVLLTFVGFFMFELLKSLRIHPIQYALVGLALAIFFLLLLGLSEHIAFGWAYLASSLACIGLLGAYTAAILRSARRGLGFAATLGLLYAALYGLLVSEDNALVLGALMLFAILATLMLVTRKVDWYAQASGQPAGPVQQPQPG
jgi:inner membrane protein